MIERALERVLFASRWLLAPFYLALVGCLVFLLFRTIMEMVHFASIMPSATESGVILGVLSVIDLTLTGSLIVIVIFSGYENFISKIDVADHPDWPEWMAKIDFSGLKIKLIGSLVAISVIELLKDFIELAGEAEVGEGTIWRIAIHLTFVISGVLFALMDWIADKRKFDGTHS